MVCVPGPIELNFGVELPTWGLDTIRLGVPKQASHPDALVVPGSLMLGPITSSHHVKGAC